ncbi:hypothetical protein ACKC9G_11375 [Pokkaliibacter sp. CJK22405]|uniref:hypothetical protein n=1 Tax=Pokkaliibacter sp. CJK22405 TaxID=3384615 RepID=UPI003984F9AD
MMIRILPKLEKAEHWQSFIQREQRYCFITEPETLVDLQANHLRITCLDQGIRNGRQAVKYSIGAKNSSRPIQHFIAHCRYSLSYMMYLLGQLDFSKSVLDFQDNESGEIFSIRKYFAREREILSPSLLTELSPLGHWPEKWTLGSLLSLLANRQYHYLHTGQQQKKLDGMALLLNILESPSRYRVRGHEDKLLISRDGQPFAETAPRLPVRLTAPALPHKKTAPEISLSQQRLPAQGDRDYLN